MTKAILSFVLISISAVSIASLTLKAAAPDDVAVFSFKGKPNWAWETHPSTVVQEVSPNPSGLAVIFSNLGPKNHLFEDNVAWDVAGPDSGVQQQWIAMPFTVEFDAEITQIAVAVEHNSGSPNSFVLSLNADGGDRIPGKVLRSWQVKHAPQFGTCCILDVVKDGRALKVNKGTQYWVVAKMNAEQEATRMEWDLSPRAIEGYFAINNGQGWFSYTAFTSAFAVYGKKIN